MATVNFESDTKTGTLLIINQADNGDITLKIDGDGEFKILAESGKLTGIRLKNIQSLFSQIISELNKGVLVLNKDQFAEMLNGRERGHEITPEEQEIAKENGLVVVYGYSDDAMVFNGAIRGQVDCWQGGTAYLDENELKKEANPKDSAYKTIRASYAESSQRLFEGKAYWTFETASHLH